MHRNLGPGPRAVKAAPVVVLTTDFGLDDPYVGILKGVLLGLAPKVPVIDLTHGVPPQDVFSACLTLEAARPYFPPGTVHVVVVDPGVGTRRRALAVFTERDAWRAPDNGVLSFLPEGEVLEVRSLENSALFLQPVSRTFHGRDVFAPAAARLASGLSPESLGPAVATIERLDLPKARVSGAETVGEILAFDRFGNGITSIRGADLPDGDPDVRVRGRKVAWVEAYADVAPGEPLCLIGSSGRVEVGVRERNARGVLGLDRGDEVRVLGRST